MFYGDFFNGNAGVWAFAALPLSICAVVAAIAQLVPALRTAARKDLRNLELVRQRIQRRRVDSDLTFRLVFDEVLPIILSAKGEEDISSAQLYSSATEGAPALVVGEAGAGKSTLALTMVRHSLQEAALNPGKPFMEVFSLRDWQAPALLPDDWKSLHRWMAAQLDLFYPSFGQRYFRNLLKKQLLIPCFDGLDEVPAENRNSLISALNSYAEAGFPLILLTREGQHIPLDWITQKQVARGPAFKLYELRPLTQETIRHVVEGRPAWSGLVQSSQQPHRVASLLGNPLLLSIAALAWGPNERPTALIEATDPEDALWTTFFERKLGKQSDERTALRRASGWVAGLATQVHGAYFRTSNLYKSPLAVWVTLVISAVPILFLAWQEEWVSRGLVLVFALTIGLSPRPEGSLLDRQRVAVYLNRRRVTRHKGVRQAIFFFLVIAICALLLVGGSLLANLIRYLAAGEGIASWWTESGHWVLDSYLYGYGALAASLLGLGATFWLISNTVLISRANVEHLLPRKAPEVTAPALGFIFILLGAWSEVVTLVAVGFAAMAPWIFLITSRQILILQKHIPTTGLQSTCVSLAELGILQVHNDSYRFRHQQLAQKLAQEVIVDLCEQGDLGHLLYPEAAASLTDGRLTARALAQDASLTGSAVEEYGRWALTVVDRVLYLHYGTLRPADALPPLEFYASHRPDTELRTLIAEALDALGRRDEAWKLWRETAERYSDSTWFLSRWVKKLILSGDLDGATDALHGKLDRVRPDSAPYEELLLAEIQCRFGSEAEQAIGIATLDRLRFALESYVGSRAATELARVQVEVVGDLAEGRKLLESSFDDSSTAALRMTRRAQINLLEDNVDEAKVLASEAARIVTWSDDPMHQLEVLLTDACLLPDVAVTERVKALLGFGWRLVGHSGQTMITGDAATDELIDRAYARPIAVTAIPLRGFEPRFPD